MFPFSLSSVRRLIILVAFVALLLFTFVAEPDDRLGPVHTVAIVGASIVALAIAMFIERARQLQAARVEVSRLWWIGPGLRSIIASTTLIGASILTFLTLHALNEALRTPRSHDRLVIRPWGLALGVIGAIMVARLLEPFLFVRAGTRPKLPRRWPIVLLALIGIGSILLAWKELWELCRTMAEHHANVARADSLRALELCPRMMNGAKNC